MNSFKKVLLDWMLNSWEHCEDVKFEAEDLVEGNFEAEAEEQILLAAKVSNLMRDWIDNVGGKRLKITMNIVSEGSPEEEEIKNFIDEYIS